MKRCGFSPVPIWYPASYCKTCPTATSMCSALTQLFSVVGDPACITVDAGSAMTSRAVEGFCVTGSIAFTVFPRQSKFIAAVYERASTEPTTLSFTTRTRSTTSPSRHNRGSWVCYKWLISS
ncbi:hypothetical protein FOL47_001135 [Perkinsus chesapeaki]|uniref:Uncharacterized protein n=1 Tax=Perkinsus chesapeaki TaxID=330153 RepID=A0A7J6KV60_PERCH|nr:hypothetical protein FOL47_001135 [Perkinsus chesapeaki]